MRYRVVLFDLFGTLAHFRPSLEEETASAGEDGPLGWLREPVHRELPDVPFEEFVRALEEITREIIEGWVPEYREVPSSVRFRKTLERLGVSGAKDTRVAEKLCHAHMQYLASRTIMPAEHVGLLRRLKEVYRLGLVSNFDHGPTVHAILAREGIARLLEVAVVSAEVGRRKPHPLIFAEALRHFDVNREQVLFVGDSIVEDVGGARAAGLDAAWICPDGGPAPDVVLQPTFTLRRLGDLEQVLALC